MCISDSSGGPNVVMVLGAGSAPGGRGSGCSVAVWSDKSVSGFLLARDVCLGPWSGLSRFPGVPKHRSESHSMPGLGPGAASFPVLLHVLIVLASLLQFPLLLTPPASKTSFMVLRAGSA